jgi:glycosyltransferase involved in cell wall biosynthesis
VNVLHVIPGLTLERGGPTAVLRALTRHQAAAGHAVTVLTTDQGLRHGEHAADLDPAVRLERLAVRGTDRLAYAPGFADAARNLAAHNDVVHVHSLFTHPAHAAFRAAGALGVPVVLRPCGLLHPYSLRRSPWVKRLYLLLWGGLVRRVTAAWHYTSDREAAESWPGPGAPHFVLPNGIEPGEFALARDDARALVRRSWPEWGDEPYVLFLGRLHPKKRPELLVEAFLEGAPPGFRLVVAGPDEQRLWDGLARRLLRHPKAAARVVRLAGVSAELRAALLGGATLFALPSEHENFGVAALESLAAGTPVLLSPHVDLADAALAYGVGFTAPLEVSAWRDRLAELLVRPQRLAALAPHARSWAAERFDWGRLCAELTRHYERIVRTRDGHEPR